MISDIISSRLKNKIVLYLEDDVATNESTAFLLSRYFKNLHSFCSPKKALKQIKDGLVPDIIITDIEMPELTGIEFILKVRELGYEKIPVIFITAYNNTDFLKAAIEIKVEKYFTKPLINTDDLIETIFNTLNTYEKNKIKSILTNASINTRTDLKGLITHASQGFCDISGYTKEELIGENHNIVRNPSMPISIYKELWETIKKDGVWKGELKNKTKDGIDYWLETTISPDKDENGNSIGYFSVSTDITKKKELEYNHIQLLKEAKDASIEELLENISHQWRQPLGVISVVAGRLELDLQFNMLSDKEKSTMLNEIVDKTQYLSKTIEKFYRYISNNKEFIKINIEDEILFAKEIFTKQLENNQIELIDYIDYNNQTTLNLIQNEVSQVIINIITNAREALLKNNCEKKWIKLEMFTKDNEIIIKIEDNAGGINDEVMSKLFDPYFTTKFKARGTGLGLHLSKRIITENLNGSISVENTQYGALLKVIIPKNL